MALRIKSAKKKHRQSLKKRARNRFVKSSLRTRTRGFLEAIEAGDASTAGSMFRELVSAFDKAASKGVIHKKNASRNVAKMSQKLHVISSASPKSQPSAPPEETNVSQAD
ncbi:MAG: 30S ribosomal protein S20 [Thermodesulfobacteriota bacterium]